MKFKARNENCSRLKGTKETQNEAHGPFCREGYYQDKGQNVKGRGEKDITIHFLILMVM